MNHSRERRTTTFVGAPSGRRGDGAISVNHSVASFVLFAWCWAWCVVAVVASECDFELDDCTSKHLLERNVKYRKGAPLCSNNGQYMFGVTKDESALVLCDGNTRKLLWSTPLDTDGLDDLTNVFLMQLPKGDLVVDGKFENGDKITLWQLKGRDDTTLKLTNVGVAVFADADGEGETVWRLNKGVEVGGGGGGGGGGRNNNDNDTKGAEEENEISAAEVETPVECSFPKKKCKGFYVPLDTTLRPGDHLCNGDFKFGPNRVRQLVLCHAERGLMWSRKTDGKPILKLTTDGRLLLKDGVTKKKIFITTTNGKNVRSLRLTRKGDVVLRDAKQNPVWSLAKIRDSSTLRR